MTITKKIHYVLKLPIERKMWFLLTIFSSLFICLYFKIFPSNTLHSLSGHHFENRLLSVLTSDKNELKAFRIGKVVEAACKGVPWDCSCHIQVLCVNFLLILYQIPAVVYLGAKLDKHQENGMVAHAWLTVGKYCIIGAEVANLGYQVTATFVRPKAYIH